jgi:hypothetical protein
MSSNLAEQLTLQFYLWEQRGRGWQVWDEPVDLEPPFEPFLGHHLIPSQPFDDGRRPTLLSNFADKLLGRAQDEQLTTEDISPDYSLALTPSVFVDRAPIYELTVNLSSQQKINVETFEHFILSLSSCSSPVSFEIVGTGDSIQLQFSCREPELNHVRQELRTFFPEHLIEMRENALERVLNQNREVVIVDFGLSEEFMRPLKAFKSFEPDPLIALIGTLSNLDVGDSGVFQVLFRATHSPWTESILRSVTDGTGSSFFADAPEMLHLAREKTKRPFFTAVIRVLGAASSSDRAWEIAKGLAGSLTVFGEPYSNEFIPLTNDGYSDGDHLRDVLLRETHRSGMLLNSEELISLVHLPSPSVHSEKLHRTILKTRGLPASTMGHKFVLGENIHQGKHTSVSLNTEQRLRHMHVIGATGTGKSTLLLNMIVQDIEQGNGLAVIDPHGDLIERVMSFVPAKRTRDVVLFDPSDAENPRGINILSAKREAEKNVIASDLVSVFRRMSTSWGDQMSVVLGNAIQAFLESSLSGTLLDLRNFLLEDSFRKEFLKSVHDNEVKYFWEKQFWELRGGTASSILTRLDTFLRPKIIRNVIAPKTELRFDEILNEQKILLIKLSQGLLGEENSTLLGTLIVSKLHQGAMARQALPVKERTPFYLYIDEFQNFITPSLAGVLSSTRKYGLGLILAHQDLRQLFNQDTSVANSVISNPGTRICFRLGDFDAQKLQDGFKHFTSDDLQNLGVGEAIMRVERMDDDFNLKVFPPRTVNPETAKSRRKRLIELSHQGYQPEKEEQLQVNVEDETEPSIQNTQQPRRAEENIDRKETFSSKQIPVLKTLKPLVLPVRTEEKTLSQHRYLQTLIKRMAEERGFKATIEAPTPDGAGRVDVLLKREQETIACEVAVTTTDEHELQNIEKCLKAGYSKVIIITPEKKRLEKIRSLVLQKFDSSNQNKVLFFEPEELFYYLEEQVSKYVVREERVKGYRVKVQYQTVDETESKQKRDSIAKVILDSMRRMKEKT